MYASMYTSLRVLVECFSAFVRALAHECVCVCARAAAQHDRARPLDVCYHVCICVSA